MASLNIVNSVSFFLCSLSREAAVFDCLSCVDTHQPLCRLLLLNAGGYDGYFKGSAASAAAAASSSGMPVYL